MSSLWIEQNSVASFFRSHILHQKSSEPSIIRLTWRDAGVFNLPVEIWQRIFELTVATVIYNGNELWVPSSTRNYLTCEVRPPSLDLVEYEQHKLFELRHSLILVCKSWYFMAISFLWIHVRIRVDNMHDHLTAIHQTLRNNPSFASYVRRLSIWSSIPMSTSNTRMISEIVSRLTRLHFVSLPHLSGPIPRGSGIVLRYEQEQRHSKFGEELLEHDKESQNIIVPSIRPRIAQLRSRSADSNEIEWCSQIWDLSSVRVLSVSAQNPMIWALAVGRMSSSLNKLELLVSRRLLLIPEMARSINFPELKTLCLSFPTNLRSGNVIQTWFGYIRAPKLQRLVFHPEGQNSQALEGLNRSYLLEMVVAATLAYPNIREIGIFTEGARIVARGGKKGLIMRDDIDVWTARGLTVEILRGYEHDRRTYRKNGIS
jgi:hypothetical protein